MDITELIAHFNTKHGLNIPPDRSPLWPISLWLDHLTLHATFGPDEPDHTHAAKHAEPIRRGSYADHAAEFPEAP